MPIWISKTCSGMDTVASIRFVRGDTAPDGTVFRAVAVFVPGADQEDRARADWSQGEIDALGDGLAPGLDATLADLIGRHIPGGAP
jgi:hypothetical protein